MGFTNEMLARLLGSKDRNVRGRVTPCPVCWAESGQLCYRMTKVNGRWVKTSRRRVMPHPERFARARRRGFKV